jgi:multisubunit Na+/H+ antiporter MnhB subunit
MRGMTIIVKKVTQLLAGLVFLYGLYIITHGHLTPGGGFAGGTIVAGSFILLIIANGIPFFRLKEEKEESSLIEGLSGFLFLLLPLIGMFLTGSVFFKNFLGLGEAGNLISAGILPIYNIIVGVLVFAGLLSIFLAFVIYKAED